MTYEDMRDLLPSGRRTSTTGPRHPSGMPRWRGHVDGDALARRLSRRAIPNLPWTASVLHVAAVLVLRRDPDRAELPDLLGGLLRRRAALTREALLQATDVGERRSQDERWLAVWTSRAARATSSSSRMSMVIETRTPVGSSPRGGTYGQDSLSRRGGSALNFTPSRIAWKNEASAMSRARSMSRAAHARSMIDISACMRRSDFILKPVLPTNPPTHAFVFPYSTTAEVVTYTAKRVPDGTLPSTR